MKDSLFAILALVAAVVAAFFFYRLQTSTDGSSMNLILGILFALGAVGLGAFYMFNKVNRHEDIHITE